MVDANIIDNFIDEREFRNYIINMLPTLGYNLLNIDDVRTSDGYEYNDNDLLAIKNDLRYTVQVYLNTIIGDKEIADALADMHEEGISRALIIVNKPADKDVIEFAKEKNITIIDRDEIIKYL